MIKPREILIDCDGVLTDGKQYIDHAGEKMFKAFCSRDVRAIRELIANGFTVTIITADDWSGSKSFAEKTGAEIIVQRDKAKLPDYFENFIAVGDDAWDVPLLKKASMAFITADADPSVKNITSTIQLTTPGGHGVIAELANILLT